MDKDTITFGETDSEKLKNDLEKVKTVTRKMQQQKEDLEKERGRILERIDELSRLRPVVQDRYVSAAVERELVAEVEGSDQTARERTIADLKVQLAEIDREMPLLERQKMLLEERQRDAQKECDLAEFDRLLLSLKTKSGKKQELIAEIDGICQAFETTLAKIRHYNNHVVPQDIQQALALKQKYPDVAVREGRVLFGDRYLKNFKIYCEDCKVSGSSESTPLPFGLAVLIRNDLGSRWDS